MAQTNPALHCKHMTKEKEQPVLCVKSLKALHGLLKSALSLHKKFVKEINEIGFELNPCDPCSANTLVNCEQQTMSWHADNVKASHVDSEVDNKFIQFIKNKHEDKNTGKAKAIRGKIHDCLGVALDFS